MLRKQAKKMISQEEREALRARIDGDTDYKAAAILYHVYTERTITEKYLYKFLRGERKVYGKKEDGHDPVKMYEALVEAVLCREAKEAEKKSAAREIRERLAA